MKMLAWIWFALVQLLTFACTVIGWALLLPLCFAHAWTAPIRPSVKPLPGRALVDAWAWRWLNAVYGNIEDGVSGRQALIWQGAPPVLTPYLPRAAAWWRAYCWSAWRNSADALKYRLAWANGPLITGTWIFGRQYRIGWHFENGFNVPVLDL